MNRLGFAGPVGERADAFENAQSANAANAVGHDQQRRSPWRFGLVTLALATLCFTVPSANACQICIPYPQKTSVDQVIESDKVAFAREDASKPFTFAAVEALKGRLDGSSIPLLVDVTTAHQLQLNPSLKAVLARRGAGGTWTFLGLASGEYQAILREAANWSSSSKTPAERAHFFAPYLGSEDRALAQLAFLEVARAPYATVRDLEVSLTREQLYRAINDWFRIEWHGLYILLLGRSDRADDAAFVRGKLNATAKFGLTTNLAAYATAYIEMAGASAVDFLAEEYLSGRPHSDVELIELVKALSAQGNGGRADALPAILDTYGRLLATYPRLAGHVAIDLFNWRVTRFAPRMREILENGSGLDGASQLAVATYLSIVDEGRDAVPIGSRPATSSMHVFQSNRRSE